MSFIFDFTPSIYFLTLLLFNYIVFGNLSQKFEKINKQSSIQKYSQSDAITLKVTKL